MKIRTLVPATVTAAALLGLTATAFAQGAAATNRAAPAAPPAVVNGPALPGVCFFSEQATIQQSMVGQSVVARLQQLVGQVKAELQPQETSFSADAHALDAARTTLDGPTLQKRAADLNLRRSNLDHLETQRQQELEYTQQKEFGRIDAEVSQILPTIYQGHNCSILLNAQVVVYGNPGMDLTPALVGALNTRIQTLTFDREPVPAQPGAPAQ